MPNVLNWRAALLLAASLLGGCSPLYVNKYTPPAQLTDVNCLNTCTREANRCNHLRLQQHKNDQLMSDSDEESYKRCQVGRSDKEIYKHCKRPGSSYQGGNYTCESDYDSCYLACGGTIERVRLQDDLNF